MIAFEVPSLPPQLGALEWPGLLMGLNDERTAGDGAQKVWGLFMTEDDNMREMVEGNELVVKGLGL